MDTIIFETIHIRNCTYLKAKSKNKIYISTNPCSENVHFQLLTSNAKLCDGKIIIYSDKDILFILEQLSKL